MRLPRFKGGPVLLPAVMLLAMVLFAWLLPSAAAAGMAEGGDPAAMSPRQVARLHARERERSLLLVDASRAYNQGQLDVAERLAKRTAALDRDHPDALTLLAMIHAAQGRGEEAGQMYQQALQLSPRRGDLLNNYGTWLCGQGQAAEALVLFDRARLDPQAPMADLHVNAGICAARSGQWARGEADLQQALQHYPDHPLALQTMAQLQLERGHPMRARAFYQRRLGAASVDASVLQLAIKVEEQLGDKAAAEHYKLRLEQAQGAVPGADQGSINGDN